MKTFLQIVAEDVFGRYGADLSRVAVVFPNKRAGLFFNEALAELSERPVWSPAYLSISDLFRRLSRFKSGDPVKLVCELYRVFRQETSSSETLDDFYYWGELLISDFDDVDKNLVDAGRLFTNLKDLKEIMNDYNFLDEEQEQAIQQFFRNFSIERRTELKERFISLWNVLGNIYHRYRQTLEEQGIAYEGMLYRDAIERLDADSLPYDRYVFVGFNVLNKVETRLFEVLRDAGKADFYWDYDQFYLHAGNRIKGDSAEGVEDGLPDTEQTGRHAVDCSSFKEGDNHEAGEFIRHGEGADREVGELTRRGEGVNYEAGEFIRHDEEADREAGELTRHSEGVNREAGELTRHSEGVSHEAGEFIRRNLEKFPSPLPENLFASFSRPKNVRFIAAPTENAQARYLPRWIETTLGEREQESAVVLCNESLLQPVLHSISPEVRNINITMGFPLAQTPVYSFLCALLELQASYHAETGRFTYAAVTSALKHPYTRQLSGIAEALEKELTATNRFYPLPSELKKDELLKELFATTTGNLSLCDYLMNMLEAVAGLYRDAPAGEDNLEQLYRESLFKAHTTVTRFRTLVEDGGLTVSTDTFRCLLNKVLAGTSIPFHGEPAIGMQIMGVLETRNLDFRNVILLSLNEGQLPKSGGDNSFIPYNLRKAFGMTTVEHRNAVYAYYFYRLMQRAENITLMYNTSSDGLNRGEQSRFMLQFLLESPHEIIQEYLEAGQSPRTVQPVTVPKTPEIMRRLQETFDRRVNAKALFTPSALNTYLDCRLKFYYYYVAALRAPREVSTEIDSATFGSIFHRAAQLAYIDLTANGKLIRKEDIEKLLHNEVKLQDYVDKAFKELFFKVPEGERPEYNGVQLINSAVIVSYLKQLFRNDLQYAPFSMEAMEKGVAEDIDIVTPKGMIKSRIGGIIDRIDSKEGTLRIVDYKTGGSPKTPADVASLFIPSEARPNYIFQTFLYAAIMQRKQPLKVAPALLYIHRAASEDYSPVIEMGEARKEKIPVDDFSVFEEELRESLDSLLSEIFNPEESFTQTEVARNCEYCDFKALCKK